VTRACLLKVTLHISTVMPFTKSRESCCSKVESVTKVKTYYWGSSKILLANSPLFHFRLKSKLLSKHCKGSFRGLFDNAISDNLAFFQLDCLNQGISARAAPTDRIFAFQFSISAINIRFAFCNNRLEAFRLILPFRLPSAMIPTLIFKWPIGCNSALSLSFIGALNWN